MRQTVSNLAALAFVLVACGGMLVDLHAQAAKPMPKPDAAAVQPKAPASPKTPARSGTKAAAPANTAVVNLNTATVQDLETLPGIGAAVAARIVDYRQKKGPFKKVEELMNVQGIGEKSFLKLKPRVSVGGSGNGQ